MTCLVCTENKKRKEKGKESSAQVVVGQKVSDKSKWQTKAKKIWPHKLNVIQPSRQFSAYDKKSNQNDEGPFIPLATYPC